jgi:hypothetical protein
MIEPARLKDLRIEIANEYDAAAFEVRSPVRHSCHILFGGIKDSSSTDEKILTHSNLHQLAAQGAHSSASVLGSRRPSREPIYSLGHHVKPAPELATIRDGWL